MIRTKISITNKTFHDLDFKQKQIEDAINLPLSKSTFIELCYSFDEDGAFCISFTTKSLGSNLPLTSHVSTSQCVIKAFALATFITPKTSNLFIVVNCLKVMFLTQNASNKWRTLNYNNINTHNVPYLVMNFDGDILFELPLLRQLTRHFNKMQGMEKRYNGHAWCNMKATNYKNDFGLGFQRSKCLGHLLYQNNTCNKFFQSSAHNEVVWNGDSINLPIVGHYVLSCLVFTIGYKLCDVVPFYMKTYKCWIYYVVHKLNIFSRITIHLKAHVHSTQDDMCRLTRSCLKGRFFTHPIERTLQLICLQMCHLCCNTYSMKMAQWLNGDFER
jgi:hypothetical protein